MISQHFEDLMSKMYAHYDAKLAIAMRDHTITCKEGCSQCCYLYIVTSAVDALNIGMLILSWPNRYDFLERLALEAQMITTPGMTRGKWFTLQRACVFLENNRCLIYARRPVECRSHYAVSPAEFCSHAHKTGVISCLNTYEAQFKIWTMSKMFLQDNPALSAELSHSMAGPFPLILLRMLYAMTRGKLRHKLAKMVAPLPTLDAWLKDHVENGNLFDK